MCGIAGIHELTNRSVNRLALEAMTQVLAHRGPDGEGYVLLAPGGKGKPIATACGLSESVRSVPPGYAVGFGHRRLAILDRSPLGHQPMSSEDERFWITYNGEIYNYLELREDLQRLGWSFRSKTDTEVVLKAYQEWGTECLHRFNGMFAFAIWDGSQDRLFCARDRLGMKPFYYRLAGHRFVFGSELKVFLQDSSLPVSPNHRMIHDFLVLGLQDHSEETFFDGIRQLRPGHYLTVERGHLEITRWWDLGLSAEQPEISDESAVRSFRELFQEAIRLHLRSDVPVGSCLSGGLDSSSIVCLMDKLLAGEPSNSSSGGEAHRLKTFSSCFEDPTCDERTYLRAVVAHAGTESVEVFPDGRRLFEEMPRILWFQEEPFGGTSYLAQWAVMRAASERGVTVLLDGQGGDELLCGYPGYWGSYLADLLQQGEIRNALTETRAFRKLHARTHPTVFANFGRAVLPSTVVLKTRSWLKGHGSWINPDFAARYTTLPGYDKRFPTVLENHTAAYLQTHSLPALLHHEDRNAMAFSIEARLPFLDTRLVDFLFRLPARLKLRNGLSKFILREAMTGVIPEVVRTRSDKMGFSTPQDRWLRGELRPELEQIFGAQAFKQRGYWDARKVTKAYREYCEGRRAIGTSVWRWVSLELWFQRFFP